MKKLLILIALLSSASAYAQNKASEGLKEKLLTANLGQGAQISGVLSVREGAQKPGILAVLLPGHPSVVKAEMEGDKVAKTLLSGNFLIRARRHLANQQVATLIADCRQSREIGDECPETYMASEARFSDLDALVRLVKAELPTVQKVWLIGTSHGTVTSSHLPQAHASRYAGVIHTSTINFAPRYVTMANVKYEEIRVPQLFIHHEFDECSQSRYGGIKTISDKAGIPLYTVNGDKKRQDEKISSNTCDAFSPHGFKGIEVETMKLIQQAVMNGVGVSQKFSF